ncbi:MAG: VWA domain-containing protein [Acidobacteria bacterium]|nr:VWA domain-containing protein [Acidobacteriota bacterium]
MDCMKNFTLAFLLVLILGFTVIGQNREGGATAPAIKGDRSRPNPSRRPPVLNDSTNLKPTTAATRVPNRTAASADDETITVETNLVTTPVSVLDRNGRFLPGLRKKDFKIFENGVAQKITYFQSEEQPFTVIIMIDTSPSTRYKIDDIHFAALTFVNQLRPNDNVMVVAFDQRLRALTPEPTTERKQLYAAIYKSQFGSGTSLYDAVDAVVNLDLLKIPGRKAVVLFTDGVDTTSRRSNFESTLAAVEETDALIYPIRYDTMRRADRATAANSARNQIDLSGMLPGWLGQGMVVRAGRGQSEAEYAKGKIYLETLALNSGGRIFEADTITNLEAAFSGVAEELRRRYSIGYYPVDTGTPGERRKIKIQVARPGAVIRAKQSYVIAGSR